MFQPEYRTLISALTSATKDLTLQWDKGQSPYSYFTNTKQNQKILIDQYYTIMNGNRVTCINLTIFGSDGKVFNENVVCSTPDLMEDFNLLYGLYSEVVTKKISPTINQITQSIQQAAHAS